MSETTESTAATAAEIKTVCPGATAEFVLGQIEACASLETAQTAFIAEQSGQISQLQARVTELETENGRLQGQARRSTPKALGMNPPASELPSSGNAVAEWDRALSAEIKTGKSRLQATKLLMKNQPDLYESYLAEYQEQHGQKQE